MQGCYVDLAPLSYTHQCRLIAAWIFQNYMQVHRVRGQGVSLERNFALSSSSSSSSRVFSKLLEFNTLMQIDCGDQCKKELLTCFLTDLFHWMSHLFILILMVTAWHFKDLVFSRIKKSLSPHVAKTTRAPINMPAVISLVYFFLLCICCLPLLIWITVVQDNLKKKDLCSMRQHYV